MKISDTVGDICFHCDINERMSCSAGREARQRLFSSLKGIANRVTVRRNRNYATLTRECPVEI